MYLFSAAMANLIFQYKNEILKVLIMSISVPHNSDMMALRRAACWNCRSFETPLLEITTCDDSDEEPPPLLDRYDSESSEELSELVDEETED